MNDFYYIFDYKGFKLLIRELEEKIIYIGVDLNNRSTSTKLKTNLIKSTIEQLKEYLDGERKDFSIDFSFSASDFQTKVWQELLKIPYGEKRSYKQIAQAINNPRASQAVGSAIGKNPLLIVIPCHRVLRSDASLGGFSAGLDKKEFLLDLESIDYNKKYKNKTTSLS